MTTRKAIQLEQYHQLRKAGFSSDVARRFRGSSQTTIESLIKAGPSAVLPKKSVPQRLAAYGGAAKRGAKVPRKVRQQMQYRRLKKAGFSPEVARRFRGSSPEKIVELLKTGPAGDLPEKSRRHQLAALEGARQRKLFSGIGKPWNRGLPKNYLLKYTWVIRYVLHDEVDNEIVEDYISIIQSKNIGDKAALLLAESYILEGQAAQDFKYRSKRYTIVSLTIIDKYFNPDGI